MPAASTHVLFAQDVYKNLSESLKKEITSMEMYLLGSQGPDFLFFSGASLLPGNICHLGNLLHDEKQDLFLPYFDQYSEKDGDLRSYFYGFLCHYALDSIAHPLICAVAKAKAEENGETAGVNHVTMEGEIDVWMLHQRGRKVSSYDVYNYLKVSSSNAEKLALMYQEMLREVFQMEIPFDKLKAAPGETAFFTKILAPKRITYNIIRALEVLLKKGRKFSGMMLLDKEYSGVLNLEKKSYPLAHDSSRIINASFPELYGKAVLLAERLLSSRTAEDYTLNFSGEEVHS